jgi:c-di-GMP-related signal transduction protein
VLDELSVASDIRAALLGEGGILGDIFNCALAYESGDWKRVRACAEHLRIAEASLPNIYRSAVLHAGDIFKVAAA